MFITAASLMIPFLATSQTQQTGSRQFISLDGNWKLAPAGTNQSYEVVVPGSWQSRIPELRDFVGRVEYTRQVSIPESWAGKRVYICFGAVDYLAEVSINGQRIGSHEGGYTPFEFEITSYVRFGQDNDIRVDVVDSGKDQPVEGIKFEEIPHGKQSWYGNNSGIWQSVRLEARNSRWIKRLVVDPDIDASTLALRVEFDGPAAGTLRLSFTSPEGADPVPNLEVELSGTETAVERKIQVPRPRLWSPDH
ncbi:MAG: hypothetical protein QHI38_06880, partial [Armatimonadota bacterium]|nr:hypothetical protein [Armatimonadota bacterium]